MKTAKPLWEYTRDLHHACEAHPVGSAMATGQPPAQWYAAWLKALHQIHTVIDRHCESLLQRTAQLQADLDSMDCTVEAVQAAEQFVNTLTDSRSISGAVYVLAGAHLMGGEIMRRRLTGYPTAHLEWPDRPAAIAVLQQYRTRSDIGDQARACFAALLAVMDEIELRWAAEEQHV
jgi:heme oxygenase